MTSAYEQMVRECAYYLWIDSGMIHGMAHDHWIAAERNVASTSTVRAAMPAIASKATKKKVAMPALKTAKAPAAVAKVEPLAAKVAKPVTIPVATTQADAKRAVRRSAKSPTPTQGATTH